jgi:hypothetical protein
MTARSMRGPPAPPRPKALTREELLRRVVELHELGRGDHQIASETSLAVGYVRRILAEARANA